VEGRGTRWGVRFNRGREYLTDQRRQKQKQKKTEGVGSIEARGRGEVLILARRRSF